MAVTSAMVGAGFATAPVFFDLFDLFDLFWKSAFRSSAAGAFCRIDARVIARCSRG